MARPDPAPIAVNAPHPVLDAYYEDEAQKRRFIRKIFDETAGDYDRVDRLLAFGSGSWYRRRALRRAGLEPGMKVLDVATGTGLVAREIVRVLGNPDNVIGLDPSPGMMGASSEPLPLRLIQGQAERLPFAAGTFDFLSLGFALRHMEDLSGVFREFRRVLKPGGRVLLLEITRPEGRMSGALIKFYMRSMVPVISRTVARHPDTPRLYRYYWDTIEACAPPERVLATMREAGFGDVDRFLELGIFSEFRGRA
jgi:demethylmenaquinone methyltransferase/2-methoxy-6-polyprenyl-1,4-benzoquinol methylase